MSGKHLYQSAKDWGCAAHEKMGLLLFVQRLREVLLHTTSIPSKPSMVSVLGIAREIYGTLLQNSKTPHKSVEPNIRCLVEEFAEALSDDSIAKAMMGDRNKEVALALLDFSDSAAQLEAARYLTGRLRKEDYIKRCTSRIIEIVENGALEKKELTLLSEGFVACVRHAGYPVQTIYHLLNVYFFDHNKQKMSARQRLEIFFSKFDFAIHKHNVFFMVEDLAANVSTTFVSVGADFWPATNESYSEFLSSLPLRARSFFNSDKADGVLKFADVEALDPQSARIEAERRLRILDDLLRFSVHKGRFSITNPALIWREKFGYVHSNRPRAPILLVPHDADLEHEGLSRLVSALESLRVSQAQRFVRAIELHGTALSAHEEESQLLNLWIALETLFVSGRDAKVTEVIDAVTPFVLSVWNQYVFGEMWERIAHIHARLWSEAIGTSVELQQATGMHQLILGIAVDKFEAQMTTFLAGLDDDPLLRQKISAAIIWAQSAKNVKRYRESLRRRVAFDINRIYRTRNKIVHSGSNARGYSEIVQLAHFYLDLTLTLLSMLFSNENKVGSVEQACLEARIIDKNLTSRLEEEIRKSTRISEQNYSDLLFGRGLLD